MHDDDLPTSEQAKWIRIAQDVREQLAIVLPTVHTLCAQDQRHFIDALQRAMVLEKWALTFDADCERMVREY